MIIRSASGEIRKPGVARVGDDVICPNYHVVGKCTEDMNLGDRMNNWGDAFKIYGEIIPVGTSPNKCTCRECGANWLHSGSTYA